MQVTRRFLMTAAWLLMMAAMANAADEITLREQVELRTPIVQLADVAEIVAADGERQQRLATLPLMPAPPPGTHRFLPRRVIADLLAARGVDLRNVQFKGAQQVTMTSQSDGWKSIPATDVTAPAVPRTRHAALLAGRVHKPSPPRLEAGRSEKSREELNGLVVSYLNTKDSRAASWRVSCDAAARHLALLSEATSTPVCQGGKPPWTGRQRFVVSFRTRDGEVQVPVYAEVEAPSAPLAVTLRPIERGETITAADVELRTVDNRPKSNGRGAAVESIEELIGMEARQTIRAGEVVYTNQVQAPLLVKRGELISVSSHAGGIRVQTTVRAREDGARGDLVQVESLQTQERFDARVVGPRAAAVFAPNRVETALRSTARK
jgi:flagella basal body P-ring formation protein FlgA